MSTIRYFGGGRDTDGRRSPAAELMRLELQKKGKIPAAERYKMLMKKKMDASKQKAMLNNNGRPMSKRAEQALKDMAAKKAAKEQKALRRMVVIQPRMYSNGKINRKGDISDVEGNIVAKVNTKNGKMATTGGWGLGKYKAGSHRTNAAIYEAIDKYSPYYIAKRRREMEEANALGGVYGAQETINLFGVTNHLDKQNQLEDIANPYSAKGEAAQGPRAAVGVTAWGAKSDNVWGTYADNAWGTMSDNAWGTASTNVWGGLGGDPFGGMGKSVQMWGTGNGKNYLSFLTNNIKALFGIKSKSGKAAFQAVVKQRMAEHRGGGSSSRGAQRTARVAR